MNIFRKYKTFDEILPGFLAEEEIRVKHKSYLAYTGQASVFSNWLKEHKLSDISMRKITQDHVSEFFIYLAKEKKLDRPTCQKYFLHVRKVFKYAKKKGELELIPFDRDYIVYPPKGKDCSAALIPIDIVPLILEAMAKEDPQLFLACMMEYYLGTRPGNEVRLIKAENFKLHEGRIRIDSENAKNGKTEWVTMSNDFVKICLEYGIDKLPPDYYIFGKKRTFGLKVISDNNLRTRFNKFRDRFKLPKEVKLYSWKHIGASFLVASKEVDLERLRQHLRHSSLLSTQHYVHKLLGPINDAIASSFPNPLKTI